MRILLLTHIYPPATDGGSKIIHKLGEYFYQQHHQIAVITSDCYSSDDFVKPHSPTISPSSTWSYPVFRLPVTKFLRRPFKLIYLLTKLDFFRLFQKGPVFSFFPFLKTLFFIQKFKPDIIIAGPFPTTISFYAQVYQKFLKIYHYSTKLVLLPCFHQFDPDFSNKILIKSLRNADLILTLTRHEKKYLAKHFSIKPKKLFVLGGGVDPEFLLSDNPLPAKPNLLFLGNFSAHKRIELLIDAFVNLSDKFPTLTLTIAGRKTLYWPNIEKHFLSLPQSIRQKITLITSGYNDSELKTLIDHSSLLVLPSVHESFGLVFIESLARLRPVIGADIPPVKELITSLGGGLIFEKGNLSDLSDKISKLLSDPSLSQNMALSGRRYIQSHYVWDKIGDNLCQKLSSLS